MAAKDILATKAPRPRGRSAKPRVSLETAGLPKGGKVGGITDNPSRSS